MILDGASTIYCNTKQNVNLQLLYEYITHRLYDFKFTYKPNIIEKDAYFIPAGYDSLPLLSSYDIQGDLSKIYNERVSNIKPKVNNAQDDELVCEDQQSFLKKYYGVTPVKRNPPTIDSSAKPNVSNMYATNTSSTPTNILKEGGSSKANLLKNISTGRLPTNYKEMYGSNTGEKLDGLSKEERIKKIKEEELNKITGLKSKVEGKDNSNIANFKKRLDALKNNSKKAQ